MYVKVTRKGFVRRVVTIDWAGGTKGSNTAGEMKHNPLGPRPKKKKSVLGGGVVFQ